MPDEVGLDYRHFMETALRDVIRRALVQVASDGLPGDHHFFISFRTQDRGVLIPEFLRKQYPEEMTIALQYQYQDLVVSNESFSVTLNFSTVPQRLTVPFAAITSFADPSVSFGLRFEVPEETEPEAAGASGQPARRPKRSAAPKGQVVPFEKLRKDEGNG
jgi:hypothetical protein